MESLAIINIGRLVSGNLKDPLIDADAILISGGKIIGIGKQEELDLEKTETVIDVKGSVVAPGLIDSHVHLVMGDYTPRQQTVGFVQSYLHGGVTTQISASEVHTPGRPVDRVGVKALSVAAKRWFDNFRPDGVKLYGGSIVIEPELIEEDYKEVSEAGVKMAKMGFGNFTKPADAEPHIRWAQKYGLTVMTHTGGASIPGSSPIKGADIQILKPDIAGHVNGGTTSLSDEEGDDLVVNSSVILQLVQAGNLRSSLRLVEAALAHQQLHRVILASDTPTGTGVMPLAMLKTTAEISSLAGLPAEQVLALATGNNAEVFGLNRGIIEKGREADLIVMDIPVGCRADDAVEALNIGDIPGISAVVTDGQIRLFRSKNTPAASKMVEVI